MWCTLTQAKDEQKESQDAVVLSQGTKDTANINESSSAEPCASLMYAELFRVSRASLPLFAGFQRFKPSCAMNQMSYKGNNYLPENVLDLGSRI